METTKSVVRPVYAVYLAGGNSTRMGQPKHLLRFHHGEYLYERILTVLRKCNLFEQLIISCGSLGQAKTFRPFNGHDCVLPLSFVFDDPWHSSEDFRTATGPATGIIAAHTAFPDAYLMVLACDYPCIQTESILQLYENYREPVTCFQNSKGHCEPLIGIWSPKAAQQLTLNFQQGKCGPSYTVRELQGNLLIPNQEAWLFNANTPKDWQIAQELAEDGSSSALSRRKPE